MAWGTPTVDRQRACSLCLQLVKTLQDMYKFDYDAAAELEQLASYRCAAFHAELISHAQHHSVITYRFSWFKWICRNRFFLLTLALVCYRYYGGNNVLDFFNEHISDIHCWWLQGTVRVVRAEVLGLYHKERLLQFSWLWFRVFVYVHVVWHPLSRLMVMRWDCFYVARGR